MVDPLDDVFGTGRQVGYTPPETEDNPAPMSPIEAQAIADDVMLVRDTLREAIKESAKNLPDVIALASQMQSPEMYDSATKLAMALGKLSTDLIGIDLKVLQESKKQPPGAVPVPSPSPGAPEMPAVPEATTADILRLIRLAEEEASAEVVDADRQPAP